MKRLTRNIIAGGVFAALAGVMMRRSPRNNNMLNRTMNTVIDTMGRLGVFRLMGRSRMLRNLVRVR